MTDSLSEEIQGPPSTSQVEAEFRSPLRPAEFSRPLGSRLGGRFSGNGELMFGLCILGFLILVGVFAPVISPHDPVKQDLTQTLAPPGTAGHLLGTDQLGRDTLSRLIYGDRNDIFIALGALLGPFLIGTVLGVLVGYRGGWPDSLLIGVTDVVFAFPILVLLIALVFVLGPGVATIIVAVTAVDWVVYARLGRTSTRREASMEYALAAQVGGVPTWRVLTRHILPNMITQSIVYAMSDAVLIILFVTTLGYLGLGIPPPAPDWGTMIAEAQPFFNNQWWLAVIPGLAIILIGFSFALIADGLARKLDAR